MNLFYFSSERFKERHRAYLNRPLSFWPKYSHHIGYLFCIFGLSTGLGLIFLNWFTKVQKPEINFVIMALVGCFVFGLIVSLLSSYYIKNKRDYDKSRCDSASYETIIGMNSLQRDLDKWEDSLSFGDMKEATYKRSSVRSVMSKRFSGLEFYWFFFLISFGFASILIGVQGFRGFKSIYDLYGALFMFIMAAVACFLFASIVIKWPIGILNRMRGSVQSFGDNSESHIREINEYRELLSEMKEWIMIVEKDNETPMTYSDYQKSP